MSIEVKYKDNYHKVIDVRRSVPVVEIEGKKRSLIRSKIRLNREGGTAFYEGYFNLRKRQIRARSQNINGDILDSALVFNAEIKTSVDLRNSFMVIELIPRFGESRVVLHELPNFKADKWKEVNFSVAIGISRGGGSAKHYIFTNGNQVLPQGQFMQQNRPPNQ